ncbi:MULTISPECIES: thermonuclease family protein [Agrobacterium]|uniref:Thermonuclease family protein n=1 Tax=Agrobacterium tumefaciens TaxID=358 RepID=A0AAE6BG74_AGRTU|nr:MULTISPECIES: thermonuclease family protein [Agrobacterium]QCL74840.1 thermonuclease family protein [Agrobacterium tumefaciens]QCL80399.1 thermonuclease family protein [Agrobacterium tumefaciens]CUX53261.1 putative nuclease [Agrobacterium sp. NCPPB 925]
MGKVVHFRSRQTSLSSSSFIMLVAFGMLASFLVGAGISYVIKDGLSFQPDMEAKERDIIQRPRGRQNAGQGVLSTASPAVSYKRCSGGARVNCIVDGDTPWIGGVKVRIADIDAPEIGRPHCASEKALGERATVRLLELVNSRAFTMQSWPGRDEDRYGRKLRVLLKDGRSIGDILVSEGLARTWTGKRQPWC